MHAQQRAAGGGQDLGQPGGGRGIAAGDHVGTPGALDEHQRLDERGIDARPARGGVDRPPVGGDPGCGGQRAAGALGEQHLSAAGGGAGR